MKPLEVGMSSIEPKCNSYLEPCLQPDVMRSTGVFFWGGKKKNDIWWQIFPVSKKKPSKVYTFRLFFFMLCLFNGFFSQKKIGWSTSSFTRRLVHKDVCWWSFIRGDGDVDVFFPLTIWWFWGASRTRRLNLRPKRNTVHRDEGSTCVGLVAGTWWPVLYTSSRWWFQIFFIFTPIWGRFPFWLIFFRWVATSNQSFFKEKNAGIPWFSIC